MHNFIFSIYVVIIFLIFNILVFWITIYHFFIKKDVYYCNIHLIFKYFIDNYNIIIFLNITILIDFPIFHKVL